MSYITPQKVIEIQNRIISFLKSNLIDPYEQQSGKVRSDWISGSDFSLVGMFPKIQVMFVSFDPTKVTQQQSGFLEINNIDLIIYYFNQNAHKFVFDDTGLTLNGESQNFEYLQYIHDTLKDNIDDFKEYFHLINFGSISKPVFQKQNNVWAGMLPMSLKTARR